MRAAPVQIKLIRHGESLSNVGTLNPAVVGDHSIGLTPRGHEQARAAGSQLGAEYLAGALVYRSPYRLLSIANGAV